MTPAALAEALTQCGCTVVEDKGDFALVYPEGYTRRARARDLAARTHDAALAEAWEWVQAHAEPGRPGPISPGAGA